jgi:hypothetical protein
VSERGEWPERRRDERQRPTQLEHSDHRRADAHPELYGQPEEQGTQWAYDREGLKRQKEERLQREAAARQ